MEGSDKGFPDCRTACFNFLAMGDCLCVYSDVASLVVEQNSSGDAQAGAKGLQQLADL